MFYQTSELEKLRTKNEIMKELDAYLKGLDDDK